MKRPTYAAVADGSETAISEISGTEELKINSIEMTIEIINEGEKYIKKEVGRIVVQHPVDVLEYTNRRTIIYRCKNTKNWCPLSLCHECKKRENLKKSCPQAKHTDTEAKAADKEEVAAREEGETGSMAGI